MDLGLSINNKSNKCTMCEVIFIENVLSKLKLCFNFALDFSSVFQYFHSICLHFWHVKDSAIRDAFKKKKKFMTNVILGGGLDVKMSYFYKLCLKSISSHSESFWKKKFWVKNGGVPQYLAIFH